MSARRRRASALAAAVVLGALGGCAQAQPVRAEAEAAAAAPAATATVVRAPVTVGGQVYTADWFVPAGEPVALVTVQHGFTRGCGNVRETGLVLAGAGLLGLCLNAPMAGGNPALADALAAAIAGGAVTAPAGAVLPARIVVGGHSAGGLFASRLGFALAALAPSRLAGAVLFDPVDAGTALAPNLRAISATGQRPVRAVNANPGPCNANGNAGPALAALRAEALAAGGDAFVGVQLIDRSSHVDVEGRDTNLLGSATCGVPRRANSEVLRTLAARWAADAAAGTRGTDAYPGGPFVDGLVAAGQALVID